MIQRTCPLAFRAKRAPRTPETPRALPNTPRARQVASLQARARPRGPNGTLDSRPLLDLACRARAICLEGRGRARLGGGKARLGSGRARLVTCLAFGRDRRALFRAVSLLLDEGGERFWLPLFRAILSRTRHPLEKRRGCALLDGRVPGFLSRSVHDL